MDSPHIRMIAGILAFFGFVFSVPSYLNDAQTWARWLDMSELAPWLWLSHMIMGLSAGALLFAAYPRRRPSREDHLSNQEVFRNLHDNLRKFLGELNAARAQYDAFGTIPSFPIMTRIRSLSAVLYGLDIPVPETVSVRHKIIAIDRWRAYVSLLISLSRNADLNGARSIRFSEDSRPLNSFIA